ncbi:carbohydrate ABC transporter permease [Paenibacillus sp. OV219]|uniref:carbohydrate ABC transporter permease n=1 Tax=Paenibacillus sp. OV219 TaxID=1884377 RepID=UPI0008D50BA7|nr:sugar ABC transporter permease [Paenibacillus sp. OV219]SEO89891.1 multiple sugar transport system permease protein/N-acetylglucosamine transport system permease protein [Paenibacillus sp. OV219]
MLIKRPIIALFLMPAVLIYLVIFLYPTLRAGVMSFYSIDTLTAAFKEWKYVGIGNYSDLIANQYFRGSVWNVFVIWLVGGLIIFVFAFLFAAILSSGVRGKGFWRSLIFLPNTVSAVVLSVIWLQYIYSSNYGFLKTVFKFLGLNTLASVQWTDSEHIFGSMVIAYCFGSIGYFMLILQAAMDRIPTDFYEASVLEGANPFHKFFFITLPLMRDVFRTTLMLWTITAINWFVWSATFGLAEQSTTTPGYYMYMKVFGSSTNSHTTTEVFNVGTGAAVGILIMIAIIAISAVMNLFFRKERLEY